MPRPSIVITAEELQKQLQEAESARTFKNWSALFEYVANTVWGKTRINSLGKPQPLTAAVIYQRVMQFKLTDVIQTGKGKKGQKEGKPRPPARQDLHERAGKYQKKFCDDYYYSGAWGISTDSARVKQKRMLKYIERLEQGSLKAGIALKCIDCCNGSFFEVQNCRMFDCALYSISPLTKKL